jgi:hypothetical protein
MCPHVIVSKIQMSTSVRYSIHEREYVLEDESMKDKTERLYK